MAQNGILSSGATSTGANVLAPTMLYDTLQSAVQARLVWRNLAAMIIPPAEIPGPAVAISLQDVDSITVHKVAEGAEIPFDAESYTKRTLTPAKYGVNVGITREMIEDAQFSVVSLNMQTAGYALAKNEDTLAETELSTYAGQSVSLTGGVLTYSDIIEGVKDIESNYFRPITIVVSVTHAEDIRNIDTFVEANKAGITDPSKRLIGTIFGMKVVVSDNLTDDTSYIVDPDKAFAIGDKRAVTMEGFDDYARDMHHIVATQRVGVTYLFANAICKLS